MSIPRCARIVLAFLGLFAANVSHAATLTVRVQGEVTVVPDALTGIFSTGDAFSLVFSVQTDATDANPGPVFGLYDLDSLSVTIGPYVYTSNSGDSRTLLVANDRLLFGSSGQLGDEFGARAALSGSQLVAGYLAYEAQFFLRGSDTLFVSDAIPDSVPGIGNFPSNAWQVAFAPVSGAVTGTGARVDVFLGGSVTSITAVPVPIAAWLLGSAMLGLAGISHRRRVWFFLGSVTSRADHTRESRVRSAILSEVEVIAERRRPLFS